MAGQNTERKRGTHLLERAAASSQGVVVGMASLYADGNGAAWGGRGSAIGARGAAGGTGQGMQRKRAKGHAPAGGSRPQNWSERRGKSENARCTLAGENANETELMFPREDWSEDRKKASH